MKKKIVYPGSFDPFTKGHQDLVKRALTVFDEIIISVLKNTKKECMFSVSERMDIIKSYFPSEDRIKVEYFEGLLVDYLAEKNMDIIMRGMRMLSDFEYEFQMSLTNRKLFKRFEAIYLVPSSEYMFISSSIVKEIARFGKKLESFVNEYTEKMIYEKL